MQREIGIGIIGAGRIGNVHAQSIAGQVEGARTVAISDIFADAARSCAERFSIPQVTDSYEELLANPQIDAVVICSSTATHTELICAAAESGKHVFCEKPIALNLADIDRALETVARTGVKLQIGFNRRFDSNFRHLYETVRAGIIGAPHIVRITSRDPAPPPRSYVANSGGIFLDMTIHDFDMARYLVGAEVSELYATGGVLIDPMFAEESDIDTCVVNLRFENGALGIIENSRQAVYGYDQRAEVFGAKGSVEASNNRAHNTVLCTAEGGVTTPKPLYFFLERYMQSYVREMQAFVQAIRQDSTPPVTGIDGRIPVVMGLAAGKSLRENRPVQLHEVETEGN